MNVRELIAKLEEIEDKEKIVHVDCIGLLLNNVAEVDFYNDESEIDEEAVLLY